MNCRRPVDLEWRRGIYRNIMEANKRKGIRVNKSDRNLFLVQSSGQSEVQDRVRKGVEDIEERDKLFLFMFYFHLLLFRNKNCCAVVCF